MRARGVILAIAILGLTGCAPAEPSLPPQTLAPALRLHYMSDPPFCLLAGIPPGIVIRIDQAADEQVVAVDARGRPYQVWWQRGFVSALIAGRAVVIDPAGGVVASDDDPLMYPATGSKHLHGHRVCFGNETLFVLLDHV